MVDIIRGIEAEQFKGTVPDFGPGDTVRVAVKVVEGDRERVQNYEGVVIRRQGGGLNETFLVRRIASHGIGVERNFLLHSPRIDSIMVMRRAKVRRAALYYLRGRTGRAARLKELRLPIVKNKGPVASALVAPVEPDVVVDIDETVERAE